MRCYLKNKKKTVKDKFVTIPISIKVGKQTYSKVAKKIISLSLSKKEAKVNK